MSSTRALPPLPPPLAVSHAPVQKLRALLAWGFGMSIAFHAILGPIVGTYRAPVAEAQEISTVSLSQRATVKVPTPPPTPQPTLPPTPPPRRTTPPPLPVPAAPPQAHLKINVPKTTSMSNKSSPTEPKYDAQAGSQQGVPQGTLASAPAIAPAVTSHPAPAGASAGAVAQPTPACDIPNATAQATQIAEVSYPSSARDAGATGEVDVLVSLSAVGAVTAAVIYRSSGSLALDEAAIRAARASTYSPDIVACQPVAGSYTFHVSFNDSKQ